MVDVVCSICGNGFYATPQRVRDSISGNLFCSMDCYARYIESRGNGKFARCDSCKAPIHLTKQQLANNKSGKFFCSKKCYGKYASTIRSLKKTVQCDTCGKKILKSPSAIRGKNYCCRECANKALEKGGHVNSGGYRIIRVDGKSIPEHRHIMAKYLGYTIPDGVRVHHINGDKLDNRLENLRLMEAGFHTSYHRAKKWDRKVSIETAIKLRNRGLTVTRIAEIMRCSRHTLSKKLRARGIYTGKISKDNSHI